MKYLLPLLAILAVGCKKTACYRCTTTVVVPNVVPRDTTAWHVDKCHFTEEDARVYENEGSSTLPYRHTIVKCVEL